MSSTRRPGSRSFRPAPEGLEDRKLLSKTVSGVDASGDTWTLRLIGPGDVRVVNQPDSSGNPIPLGQPADIDTITVAGANPLTTRLIGHVTKAPNGTGKVFFQHLEELGGQSEGVSALDGVFMIDMPNFWLAHTSTTAPTAGSNAADIKIPDGVNVLRFGGVDTTYTPTGGTPLSQSTSNTTFDVALGLPRTLGTSIIIDKAISSSGGTASGSTTPSQNEVQFHVEGRLNVFQANEIDGNASVPSTHFEGGGGTILFVSDGSEGGAASTIFQGQIVGPIGYMRVGGNATNFSVQSNDKISNFYIGGETNNVYGLGVGGIRNVFFGKGMDTTTLQAHTIFTLQANRGALNSNVSSDRTIAQVRIGGDVQNTNVGAGYNQGLAAIFRSQSEPTTPPNAQDGGAIQDVLIAGNIKDSVFSASVQPENQTFGLNDLNFPHARIKAKVEGTIDNSTATPDTPTNAFYAKSVQVQHGPVTPPSVPEEPLPKAVSSIIRETRVKVGLQDASEGTGAPASTTSAAAVVRPLAVKHPKGPAK
jgi:hypothetical protein